MPYIMQNSFDGGEFSDSMYGRTDIAKYGVAAKTLQNFFIHPDGGASNRAGLEYILSAKYPAKKCILIPFKFSVLQAYALEFGDQYIRFYKDGGFIETSVGSGIPYEISSPYLETELAKIKFTQSADVLYICHPNHKPMMLTRTAHNSWTITDFDFKNGPFSNENITTTTITPSAKTGNITLTASSSVFQSGHVGALFRISHNIEGPGISGSFTDVGSSSSIITNDQWNLITHGTWTGKLRLKRSLDGGVTYKTIRSYSSKNDNNTIDSDTTDTDLITDGIIPMFILECYEYTSGTISYDLTGYPYIVDGIAKITAVTNGTAATANVLSQLGETTATKTWAEGAWSTVKGFPSVDIFYQNRLMFANTVNDPQTIWGSKTGDYNNFKVSNPVLDDDGITIPLVSNMVNEIRSMVAMSDILALTSSCEWRVSPATNASAITPTSIMSKPQGYRGSSNVDPVIVGNRVVFIQEMGSTVRDLGYDFAQDGYTGNDLTVLARHLFANHKIVSWAYQQEPDSIIWLVRDDGILLGLTYLKEHDVWAWHKHVTNGYFESVITIPGNSRDEPWFVIRRTVGGNTVRFIERMNERMTSTDPADQFFVDAGLSYVGTPATVISGLDHLEGKTVSVLADGNVHPQIIVTNGTITLDYEASKVHAGLQYIADLETMNLDFPVKDGTIQGRKKKITHATLRVQKTRGGFIGPDTDHLNELKMRSSEPYDTPIALFSGDKVSAMSSKYGPNATVCVRQVDPLPITVLSIIAEVDFGGT